MVYTASDSNCLHAQEGREAHEISSYSNIAELVRVAQMCGAEAIHPGWGFASENPRFPQECKKAGIVFVGPSEEAMKKVGDKRAIKNFARKAGIPVIESTPSGIKKRRVGRWAVRHGLSDSEQSTL
jgi:acetyl/propionyl-CoA carboxylase alpha subunit